MLPENTIVQRQQIHLGVPWIPPAVEPDAPYHPATTRRQTVIRTPHKMRKLIKATPPLKDLRPWRVNNGRNGELIHPAINHGGLGREGRQRQHRRR
jgi:hypothetical protein